MTLDALQHPSSFDTEQAVLGALLLDNDSYIKVADRLKREDFYDVQHRQLADVILPILQGGGHVDFTVVSDKVAASHGLVSRLTDCAVAVVTTAGLVAHVAILRRDTARRRIFDTARRMVVAAQDAAVDLDRLIETVQQEMAGCLDIPATGLTMQEVMRVALIRIEEGNTVRHGLRTGLSDLDAVIGSLDAGQKIVIGGRPGMGKSCLAMQIALRAAETAASVLVISLEMTAMELGMRSLASTGNIPFADMWRGVNVPLQHLKDTAHALGGLPLVIQEMARPKFLEVVQVAKQHQLRYGVGLLVIDNMNLMQGATDYETITDNSAWCKALAKELAAPVLAVYQLNRQVESRDSKRPSLADLRQSGQIEADADGVWLLYRKSYYEPAVPPDLYSPAELIIAKQRNGPTGTVHLTWTPSTMTFSNGAETLYAHA